MSTTPAWSVGVVIPARDEAELIEPCVRSVLDALAAAVVDDRRVAGWVVVVADRCVDDTARRATRILGRRGEVHECGFASVGAARAFGAERVLSRFSGVGPDRIWLLATDADSIVPREWVGSHLRAAGAGAVAVAGTVTVASFDEHPAHVADLYRRHYAVHADGRHAHLHGANLGVRADAYCDVDGWRPLSTGEDHDLWERLRARGGNLVSTIEAPVVTSGRRRGRAPDGFAAFLERLGRVGNASGSS